MALAWVKSSYWMSRLFKNFSTSEAPTSINNFAAGTFRDSERAVRNVIFPIYELSQLFTAISEPS